jgi:histidinol-phosphate aminotransferase
MKIENLVRDNIRRLKPYSSARSEYSGTASVFLDANENGHDLFGYSLNRYPDPLQGALKERIAKQKKIAPENIFLGNGSDEAIDLLFRIFCEPGVDEAITCPPTYGMYQVQADIHGTPVRRVLLDENFQLRPQVILNESGSPLEPVPNLLREVRGKLLFLCSPNNPTGNLLDPAAIEFLLKNFPGIVVVDEAYGDFSAATSWSQRLAEFPNLVVLQTFSKAWALAGARLGMAFASPEIIHYLNSVKYPYNVGLPTQRAVLAALEKQEVATAVDNILSERKRLADALRQFSFVEKIYPSDANFILVKMKDSALIFNYLKQNGVVVRDRSKEPYCDGCLRITVGTPDENSALLELLAKYEQVANPIH